MEQNVTYTLDTLNCTYIPDTPIDQCAYKHVSNMTALDMYTFVLYLPINLVIAILGIIGNTLAYIVMSREMDATCSTVCLKALAVADNMVLVTFSLYFGLPQYWKYLGMCMYCTYIQQLAKPYLWAGMWFSKTLSIYIIVQMTAERFIAVCMPLKALNWCTERAAWKGLLFIVIFDLAYNLPKVFQYQTVYVCDQCTGLWVPNTTLADFYKNQVFRILYTKTLYYLIIFIVPISILVVLNTKLISTIKRARSFRRRASCSLARNTTTSNDGTTEKIVGVVVAFLVLESPALFYNVLTIFRDHAKVDMGIDWKTTGVIMRSLYIISMVNSFINLYIYCVVGKRFRRELIRTILFWKKRRYNRGASYISARSTSLTEKSLVEKSLTETTKL